MKNKFYLNQIWESVINSSILLRVTFISSLFISILSILIFNYFIDTFFSFNREDFIVGEPAKSDYVVKSDFSYFNELETNIAKEVKGKLALPVYRLDSEITLRAISKYDFFSARLRSLMSSNLSSSVIREEINSYFPELLTNNDINRLKALDLEILLLKSRTELERILNRGFISNDIEGNGSGLLRIVPTGNSVEGIISAASVLKSIDFQKSENLSENYLLEKLLKEFTVENSFFDKEQTKHQRDKLLEEVSDVFDIYKKGDHLVRKDIVLSNEDFKKIIEAENSIKNNFLPSILLVLFSTTLLYLASIILLNSNIAGFQLKDRDKILLAVVSSIYVPLSVITKYLLESDFIYPFILPTVLVTMTLTFLYNNRVALYLGIIYSFGVLLISGHSVYAFMVSLILAIMGTLLVHNIERRIDLLKSTVELVGVSLVTSFFFFFVGLVEVDNLPLYLTISVVSSIIYGVLLIVILPITEHTLRISTCFQLKELCDLNAPLLKSMLVKAPGTYAHSVAVANMAESAAQQIGANPLLAKAGGYYHDIGKIDQPHYFIENQKGGKNVHDDMKPSLSVAVIKSHVKLGIEKGKTIGLPSEIIDIIEQHHGKGSIKYFLNKALNDNKNIVDDDFRYGGPNPQKPEAAIVLLADSVEAAVRSLKNPTISQLHKFIWEIIMAKLTDGILDGCGLTLSDLTSIKDAFVNTLVGYYHSRIEYPTEDN